MFQSKVAFVLSVSWKASSQHGRLGAFSCAKLAITNNLRIFININCAICAIYKKVFRMDLSRVLIDVIDIKCDTPFRDISSRF